jgi:cob(I)alamin adenosyltransferase
MAGMKIYTKTGDDGTTGLFGGQRVPKSDARIECIGSIDELNAAIGWATVVAPAELAAELRQVQNELFVIGSALAFPGPNPPASLPRLDKAAVMRLETEIDAATAELATLANFILPGGGEASARLHLARAICRRAERTLVAFAGQQAPAAGVMVYLNRLGDWLFTQARWANNAAGIADVLWRPEGKSRKPE